MRVAAFLIAACLAGVTGAQEQEERPQPLGGLAFRDQVELTIVNIVVNVTDKDGRAVTDLTADDFQVTQDGEPKQITNFKLYTEDVYKQYYEPAAPIVPTPAAAAEAAPEVGLRPVYLVIYIDHFNLNPLDRNRILNQVRSFIVDNLRPPVQMMVVSRQQTAKVVQDFTSQPRLVLDALRGIRMETGNRPALDRERNALIQTMQSREYNPSNLNDPYQVHSQINMLAQEETQNLQFTLSSLREIISMVAGLDGKKSILYVSNGLPMIPCIGLYYAYAKAYNDPSAIAEAPTYDQSRAFESLVAAANAQDISLYTIDAGGLRAAGVATAEYSDSEDARSAKIGRQNYLDSLRFLADGTGGMAIVDTNDVRPWLDRVKQDFYTYYSIGYPLQQSGADKVHDIRVRLPGHPEYQVRYRRRFVEKSLETRVQEKVMTGLVLPLQDNPMKLRLKAGRAAAATQGRCTVPLTVSFPLQSVALLPEGDDYVGRVVLFVAARDADGGQSDVVRERHELRIPASYIDEARRRRFDLRATLLMKEGSQTVAIGLLDQLTRQASYDTIQVAVAAGQEPSSS